MSNDEAQVTTTDSSGVSVALTREGWIYLVVWLFVTSGALLRNISMLVLMAALMIAPLLIGWRVAQLTLRRLRCKRLLPRIAFAGDPVDITWEVVNERHRLSTWQMVLHDQGRPLESQSGSGKGVQAVRLLYRLIRPQECRYESFKATFTQRGAYEFGPAKLSTRFPFGLMTSTRPLDQVDTLFVAPRLGKLSATWDRRLLSLAAGENSVKRKRALSDDEFFALRAWRSGDSLKQVHWRSTAKFGIPMVKQFDTRTDKDVALILDLYEGGGVLASRETANDDRVEQILSFGATLFSKLENRVFGLISVAICGANCDFHSDQSYSKIAWDVFRSLALARSSHAPTTLRTVLEMGRRASEGTPIYVFSSRPFTDDLLNELTEEELIRYRSLQAWVRWVDVSSAEFAEIFSSEPAAASLDGGLPSNPPRPPMMEVARS